jgi:hypothetical protein
VGVLSSERNYVENLWVSAPNVDRMNLLL